MSARSIFTLGTGTPRNLRLRCSAERPSSTPPATPIAPVAAGITTLVTVLFIVPACSLRLRFDSLALPFPPLGRDAARLWLAALFRAEVRPELERLLRLLRLLPLAREDLLDPALAVLLDPFAALLDPFAALLDPFGALLDPFEDRAFADRPRV